MEPVSGGVTPDILGSRHKVTGVRWLWLSALVVVLDLGSKWLASANLALHRPVEVVPNLYLTLAHNSGAAFSFLQDAGGWQRWFFAALAIVISGVLIAWIRRLPNDKVWLPIALALVLGGALGNLWDRLTLGYVVDFIQVYLPFLPWRIFNPWPAFNVADSAITVGALMLVVDAFRGESE